MKIPLGALSNGGWLLWIQKDPLFIVNHREAEVAHGMQLFCALVCFRGEAAVLYKTLKAVLRFTIVIEMNVSGQQYHSLP